MKRRVAFCQAPALCCLFVLGVGCLLCLVVSAWPVTLLQVAQDDLCILCTYGVSTRAKKIGVLFLGTGDVGNGGCDGLRDPCKMH